MASGGQNWVWVRVYTEEKDGEGGVRRVAMGRAIELERPRNVNALCEAVKAEKPNGLAHCDANRLEVYPPNPNPTDENCPTAKIEPYRAGEAKFDYETTDDRPLVVVAPAQIGESGVPTLEQRVLALSLEQRQLARHLQSPPVIVKLWMEDHAFRLKVASFKELDEELRKLYQDLPWDSKEEEVRVYYIPDNKDLGSRRRVIDEATWLAFCRCATKPSLFLYVYSSDGSPSEMPSSHVSDSVSAVF